MSDYDDRLDHELVDLLVTQRVAALGTLQEDGMPYVTMVPYAIEPRSGRVVLQVAHHAPHTTHMLGDPRVSLLVPAQVDTSVATPARITLDGRAQFLEPGSADWQACRSAFAARHPDNGAIASMLEFDVIALRLSMARQTSGFGAMRQVAPETLQPLLAAA